MDSSGQNANPINATDAPQAPIVESTNVTPGATAPDMGATIAQVPETPAEPEVQVKPDTSIAPEQVTTGTDFETNTPMAAPVIETEKPESAMPAPEAFVAPTVEAPSEAPVVEKLAEPASEAPVVEAPVEPTPEVSAEPVVEAPVETPAIETTAVEAPVEPIPEAAAEEKPAVGAAALDEIKPLEQNLAAEQPAIKPASSTANTILIVLIVLSALVLAASIIAFFFMG